MEKYKIQLDKQQSKMAKWQYVRLVSNSEMKKI